MRDPVVVGKKRKWLHERQVLVPGSTVVNGPNDHTRTCIIGHVDGRPIRRNHEQTVYNHFPTKEDLVFWRRGTFEAQLLAAIRDRPRGDGALAAFGRFIAQPRGGAPEPDDASRREVMGGLELASTIMDSPALRARERAIVAGYTAPLAALLAEDTGASADDIEPWVVATAMLGVTQALIEHARRRVLAGARPPVLTRELRARARRAVALLEQGLGGYAVKSEAVN